MRGSKKLVSMLLVLCLTLGALPLAMAEEVVDADLTCTITLGNWPADTAAEAEKALFESYRETMKKQYPNVTLVPDYYSYTLSSYVPMAKGGTAPSIFQPPFTDPQLLISQHLVGDVTDALERAGVLNEFSPSYLEMLSDENGRIYGLPRDGYVLGMHINVALFREAGLVDEEIRKLIATQVDGIIYVTAHERIMHCIPDNLSIPAVMAYGYTESKNIPSVVVDDERGAYEMIRYLIAQGHKKIGAQTGIVMRIMGADKEKGLFSVGVDRTFVHPNGKTGTVKCSRTVLADKLQIVEIQKYYVQFYKDAGNSECYKKYCVTEGDTISAPAVPEYKDREFAGWQDDKGYEADFSQPVEQNRNYYAVWK